MQNVVTAEQLTEQIELLNPPQRETVYRFISSILSKKQPRDVAARELLMETSVWSEGDVGPILEAQADVNAWRIPTQACSLG